MKALRAQAVSVSLVLAAVTATPSEAGNCASGAICSFLLNNTDLLGSPLGALNVLVTLNNTSAASGVTVSFVSSNLPNAPGQHATTLHGCRAARSVRRVRRQLR